MVGMRLKSWLAGKAPSWKFAGMNSLADTQQKYRTHAFLSRLPSFCLHNWLLKSLVDLCFNYSEFGIHLICKLSLMYLFSEPGTGLSKRHSLRSTFWKNEQMFIYLWPLLDKGICFLCHVYYLLGRDLCEISCMSLGNAERSYFWCSILGSYSYIGHRTGPS